MKILALDISFHTGYAVLSTNDTDRPDLMTFGTTHLGQTVEEVSGSYPENYYIAARLMAQKIIDLVTAFTPDKIVIEELNSGKNRNSQKKLCYVHYAFYDRLMAVYPNLASQVFYIDSMEWRKKTGITLSKEQRALNSKLSKAKSVAKKAGKKLDKKALGINGKITKKHLAIYKANDIYKLTLKPKDNDSAEAILQGVAFINGAKLHDGKSGKKPKKE